MISPWGCNFWTGGLAYDSFIINVCSNDQQNALKYLKDIEVNLSNILIMIGDFNIKNNN